MRRGQPFAVQPWCAPGPSLVYFRELCEPHAMSWGAPLTRNMGKSTPYARPTGQEDPSLAQHFQGNRSSTAQGEVMAAY